MCGRSASHAWYSHEEGHQLNQGLLLGAGGKLGDSLDDFVHDAAQVALQLLPPLLYKLGVLGRQTGVLHQSLLTYPTPHNTHRVLATRQLTFID